MDYKAIGIEQSFAMWKDCYNHPDEPQIEGSFCFTVEEKDQNIEIYLNKSQILNLFQMMKNEIENFKEYL